jgi:hypothetical protein
MSALRRGISRAGLGAAVAIAVAVAACGGEAAPKSPSNDYQPPSSTTTQPAYTHPNQPYPSTGAASAQPQPGTAPVPVPPPPPPSAGGTMVEVERAQRELDLASGDCTTACRALASMDRAAGRVCAMSDEQSRCEDAKGRVRSARAQVKKACGSCPNGPSVDDQAPIPSVR